MLITLPKDTEETIEKYIENSISPKKVTFDKQVTVKITESEKTPIEVVTTKSEICDALTTIDKLESRIQELNNFNAQQNCRLENLQENISRLTFEKDQNWKLYQNEWLICEQLTKDIKKLTEIIEDLKNKKSNKDLSRKFIMKIQTQIIRRKDKELKEFAIKINQLKKENNELQADIDEYKSLAEQWKNPDLTQVFSPDTITTFENIIAQCETNLVSTNNDTNPEMEISDKDIEIISQYLNLESIDESFISNYNMDVEDEKLIEHYNI